MWYSLSIFSLTGSVLCVWFRKSLPLPRWKYSTLFPGRLAVSALTCRSVIQGQDSLFPHMEIKWTQSHSPRSFSFSYCTAVTHLLRVTPPNVCGFADFVLLTSSCAFTQVSRHLTYRRFRRVAEVSNIILLLNYLDSIWPFAIPYKFHNQLVNLYFKAAGICSDLRWN